LSPIQGPVGISLAFIKSMMNGRKLRLVSGVNDMPHKLLIVDDEETILFAMREYFSTCGFEVDTARESEEAKARIEKVGYAVAIVDLRLAGFTGTEGLDVVRFARQVRPETRIVVLTAYGTAQLERQAAELGVDSFLQKPKPMPDIAQVVYGLLSAEKPERSDTVEKVGG
jgi:ActR/RegA family two-component response regulator